MYIAATISKNSFSPDKVEEIIKAGATVLRYNFSHGTPGEMQIKINAAREVIKKLGLEETIKIMADIPGNKIRIGKIQKDNEPVKKGDLFTFKSDNKSINALKYVPINFPEIGKVVKVGQEFTLADGEIGFKVTEIINNSEFKARALNTWFIPQMKAINLGRSIDELDHFTPQTKEHIENLWKVKPDYVAFSFVNSKSFLVKLKTALEPTYIDGWKPIIMSKIESPLALKNIKGILEETDAIMVARGDLGLSIPIEELGLAQKVIVLESKKAKKEVIVATQILNSLVDQFTPLRAEILDLTNIVQDGADGILLARETGLSLTPGFSVEMAKKIINFVESKK